MNTEPPQSSAPRKVKTCLLVDDTPINLRLLEVMLEKIGIKATPVGSAQEALEKLNEENYDVLVTDLWMPKMNGEELVKLIRQDPRFRDLPVLAVTADPDYADNFDMQHFDAALVKPIAKKVLKKALLSVNISIDFNQ